MLQKFLHYMRVSSLILLLYTTAFAVDIFAAEKLAPEKYSDLPTGWSKEAMESAINNGYLYGYEGRIYPKNYLSRAQLASITNRIFGVSGSADISRYYDIPQSAWFFGDIEAAVYKKSMVGSNDKFFPYRDATREEAFVVLARLLDVPAASDLSSIQNLSDFNQISSWAKDDLASMVESGYMLAANGNLQPKSKITREEFAYVIYKFSFKTPPISEQHYPSVPQSSSSNEDIQNDALMSTEVDSYGSINLSRTQNLLENQEIKGDIIINEGIDGGALTLKNVKVSGNILINSKDLDAIILEGSSSSEGIIINNSADAMKIYCEDAFVQRLLIETDANFAVCGNIGDVIVNSKARVEFSRCTISSVNVEASSSIKLADSCSIEALNVKSSAAYSTFDIADSNIYGLFLDSLSSSFNSNSSIIGILNLSHNAAGTTIALRSNTTVELIELSSIENDLTVISGSIVEKLIINSSAVNSIITTDELSSNLPYIDDDSVGTVYVN